MVDKVVKMISERGINLHIHPVMKKIGNDISKTYELYDSDEQVIFRSKENCQWTYNCFNLMDYLATQLKRNFDTMCMNQYGKILTINDPELKVMCPLLTNPNRIIDMNKAYFEGYDNDGFGDEFSYYSGKLKIRIIDIFNSKKVLKSNYQKILPTIKMASEFKFQTIYKFGSLKDGKLSFNTYYANPEYDTLFNIDISDDNKSCTFIFDTMLSQLFFHNIMVGAYSYIHPKAELLSPTANVFYRKKILPYHNIKFKMNIYQIAETLNLSTNRKYVLQKTIDKIITELVDLNLIKSFSKSNQEYTFSSSRPKNKVCIFPRKAVAS